MLKRVFIFFIFIFIFAFSLSFQAFSGVLESHSSLEIEQAFKTQLKLANKNQRIKIVFSKKKKELSSLAERISSRNKNLEKGSVQTKVKIMAQNDYTYQWQEVGYISFEFIPGRSNFALDDTLKIDKDKHHAYLSYIRIENKFQGKGYARDALRVWHSFLDHLDVPYTVLGVDSKTKYAALTYKKAAYQFTLMTLDRLDSWYKELALDERILKDENLAEEEYLQDSTRLLCGHVALMIRFNQL